MNNSALLARRIVQLLVGLVAYGVAISMMVRAALGVPPWDVLTQGLMLQTGLPFGVLTNIIGALVLLLWIPIRQKPGLGTIANVLFVGPSIELGLALIAAPTELWQRVLLFAAGLGLLAIASGLYIGARFGPGPRDGLMTGIHNRWGFKIWWVRSVIEITVLAIGWLLGGNVGLGTLAFALLVGPMVGITLPRLRVPTPVAPAGSAAGIPVPAERVS
ncbi:membrane protein [Conyzicola nivalis]|uniref:Membrane protein n=1 Tax=Conyzicola nivalis TaxID=1477021 RepID=A0A916SRD4_9MICO|nr:hypothetical protein [Conyzicola nivalis]GGB09806.1 membrane protein [Conyzicola nivalis]